MIWSRFSTIFNVVTSSPGCLSGYLLDLMRRLWFFKGQFSSLKSVTKQLRLFFRCVKSSILSSDFSNNDSNRRTLVSNLAMRFLSEFNFYLFDIKEINIHKKHIKSSRWLLVNNKQMFTMKLFFHKKVKNCS